MFPAGTPVQLDWVLCKHHIDRKRGEPYTSLKELKANRKTSGEKKKSD
jgi:hypothetical protein